MAKEEQEEQNDVKVELKGNNLVITIPCEQKNPRPSKSGKTLVVASTYGNITTDVKIKGKPVKIGLNAYIPN